MGQRLGGSDSDGVTRMETSWSEQGPWPGPAGPGGLDQLLESVHFSQSLRTERLERSDSDGETQMDWCSIQRKDGAAQR